MTVEVNPGGVACNLGCSYCLDPETPILMDGGYWIPIREVAVGDQVVGFDENLSGGGRHRRYRRAEVEKVLTRRSDVFRVVMEDGSHVKATPDHPWLTTHDRWRRTDQLRVGWQIHWLSNPVTNHEFDDEYRLGYVAGVSRGDAAIGVFKSNWHAQRGWPNTRQYVYRLAMCDPEPLDRVEEWCQTVAGRELTRKQFATAGTPMEQLGTRSRKSVLALKDLCETDPRSMCQSWSRGWIAGLFDAEGTANSLRISCDDDTLKIAEEVMTREGFSVAWDHRKPSASVNNIRVLGGLPERVRFFSMFRPAISRKLEIYDCSVYGAKVVASVEPAGDSDVVDLTTSTATFVAGGLLSHNCYQNDLRSASMNKLPERDMEAMKLALMEHGQEFTVFGGEALLTPIEDLDELFRFGHEQHGRSSIQTNGALVTDRHLDLFEAYHVHVGISVDGPGDLNDERRAGTVDNTRRQTEKTHQAIRDCCTRGIPVSIIITLHKGNAGDEDKLQRMEEWFFELDDLGITAARLHSLEVDNADVASRLVLSSDELIGALRRFGALPLKNLRFDVFDDVDRLLTDSNASVTCTWQGKCDPLTTTAVQGVNPDGTSSNCGRTNKDGVNWLKAETTGFERGLALYQTPQEYGGCKGCRFFALCGGQCNGTGIDADWRNRSDQCETWYAMFEEREAKLLREGATPVTLSGEIEAIERELIESWSGAVSQGNPSQHGDSPHGDSHGDSDDPQWVKETGWQPSV